MNVRLRIQCAALALFVICGALLAPTAADAQEVWTSGALGKRTVINMLAGVSFGTSECAKGKFVVGMEVRSGWYVDGMRVQCATLGPNGEHLEQSQSLGLNWVGSSGGGQLRTLRCPAGKVVTAFRGRAGEFIDQVQFACRSWRQDGGAYGTATYLSASGGTGGDPFGPAECPAGMALNAIYGKNAGSYVGYFYFTCQGPPPVSQAAGVTTTAQPTLQTQGTTSTTTMTRTATTTAAAARLSGIARTGTPTGTRGSSEVAVSGENFLTLVSGRQAPNVSRLEINGTTVEFRIAAATRIVATVSDRLLGDGSQPVTVTVVSGTQRITGRFPLR